MVMDNTAAPLPADGQDATVWLGAQVLLGTGSLWDVDKARTRLALLVEDWRLCGRAYWTDVRDHYGDGHHIATEARYRTDHCMRAGCPRCGLAQAEYGLRSLGPVMAASYGDIQPVCLRLGTRLWGPKQTRAGIARLLRRAAVQEIVRGTLGVITVTATGCDFLLLIRPEDTSGLMHLRRAWAQIAGGATRIERLPYALLPFADRGMTVAERALAALVAEAQWSPYTAAAQHPDAARRIRGYLDERLGGETVEDDEPIVQMLVRGPMVERARRHLRADEAQARMSAALRRLVVEGQAAASAVEAVVDEVRREALGLGDRAAGGGGAGTASATPRTEDHAWPDSIGVTALSYRLRRMLNPRPSLRARDADDDPSPDPPQKPEPRPCPVCGHPRCVVVEVGRLPWRTARQRGGPDWTAEPLPPSDLRQAGGLLRRAPMGGHAP